MRTHLLPLVLLAFLCSCGRTPAPSTAAGPVSTVSAVPVTPLPPIVPPVMLEPTRTAVDEARTITASAREDVRTVLAAAPPPQIAAPLVSADGKLTAAVERQTTAVADLKVKGEAVAAGEVARMAREKAMQGDIAALRAAAEKDKAANERRFKEQAENSAEQIKQLEEANAELKAEVDNRARLWLTLIGVGLWVLSALSIAAWLKFGFTMGGTIAVVGGIAGGICLALAKYLAAIQLVVIIGLSVLAVAVIGWGVWHAFQHIPVKPQEKGGGK